MESMKTGGWSESGLSILIVLPTHLTGSLSRCNFSIAMHPLHGGQQNLAVRSD